MVVAGGVGTVGGLGLLEGMPVCVYGICTYMYVYIYVCVCMCVSVYMSLCLCVYCVLVCVDNLHFDSCLYMLRWDAIRSGPPLAQS